LQDVIQRVDRAFQAFFRRVKNGETPGYPRFQGRNRYNSFTYPQFENGTHLDRIGLSPAASQVVSTAVVRRVAAAAQCPV
jgi:putative transposase